MVGERFAASVLKETLGLTPDDIESLRVLIERLKEDGPALMDDLPTYMARAEATEYRIKGLEMRMQAICFLFKSMEPEKWAEAEAQALAYFKKKDATVPKEG